MCREERDFRVMSHFLRERERGGREVGGGSETERERELAAHLQNFVNNKKVKLKYTPYD